MSFDAHKNFAISIVTTAPNTATAGTSLVVNAGSGTLFPAAPFNATIWPTGTTPTSGNAEIVRVTSKSTDTFTITRAQENSTARTVIVGDNIAATVTAKMITDIESAATSAASSTYFNVKSSTYGAVGDGSHDDTTAIQAAITAALATSKGTATVFFPAGIYKITAALNCTSATISASGKGVILRGEGHEASQIFKNSSFGVGVTFNGNGGPAGNNTAFGGMIDISINGNATTGGLLQTNSAQQMFFRGVSYIGSNDWAWDLNTTQDSYFEQITFNNNGSTTAPVMKIYGSANGTSNMLWFNQVRIETFLNGAVWITRGAGATGGGNNGIFWSQVKLENFPTVNGDIFVADGYTQQLIMDQIFIDAGQFNTAYSTPTNGIVFGDGSTGSGLNQASFTNIFMNAGTNIGNSVLNIKGHANMNGPVTIDNIFSDVAMVTSALVVNTASTLSLNISNVRAASGTAISGDGTTGLGTSGKLWTANGTNSLPTWQSPATSSVPTGIVTCTTLTSGNTSGSLSNATTASVTPTANNLVLLTVSIRNGASTNPTAPTVAGNGLTWVQVDNSNYDSTSGSRRTVYLFRGLAASPSAGTIVITFGETETDASWVVDQFGGVNTSGTNGSGAIVQSVKSNDQTGSVSTLTETLATFSSSLNAAYATFGTDGAITPVAGTGFALKGHAASGTNVTSDTEFVSAVNTSAAMSWAGNALIGGIALEIKASIVG